MVSVITTVKNGSRYLEEMLDSVRNQTFKLFEHIIVDDGSSDNTVAILEEYKLRYPNYNLKVYKEATLGRGKALNVAVSKAQYDWVSIIDCDDLWHPAKLYIQYEVIKNNNTLSLLCTDTILFRNDVAFSDIKEHIVDYHEIKRNSLLYKSIICHSSVMMRKEYAKYDEFRHSQFDKELWLRMAFEYKLNLGIVKQNLTYHRIHDQQSFEASKGSAYIRRSMKLSISYSVRYGRFLPVVFHSLKFLYTIIVPRKIRFKSLKDEK